MPSVTSSATHKQIGTSGADSQGGGFVYILGPCGSLNELSCGTGSFSHCLKPHKFFQSKVLRFYIPMLEPWVMWSVSLPICSSWFILTQMWDHQPPPHLPRSSNHHLAACPLSPSFPSLPQLHVPTPPTGVDECFFNSLVVGLPYSLIFW